MTEKGRVTIIGAGPGDPGLITLRGVQCIREAEVIVYDHLVSPEILRHAGEKARLIYAGKQGGKHTISQEEINDILVAEAGKGAIVARLKGGDPFIFGRGGEEAEVLREAGIPFEVVPGVTSAVAAPAYAGIPLTHRSHTASVAFVTGHEDPTKGKSSLDWPALAGIGTLVVLMAIKNLAAIAEKLIRHGKDAATPAALIRWGTTPDQETLIGTLGDIARKAEERGFAPPSVLVVGGVVALRETLNWFETKPLFGRGIVITRPEAQAEGLAELLRAAGARVIPFPVIRIAPPQSWEELDQALDRLEDYQWLIFTSANGVAFFFRRLRESRQGHPRSQGDPDRRDRPGDGLGGRGAGDPGGSRSGGIRLRGGGQGVRRGGSPGKPGPPPAGQGGARRHPRGARKNGRPVRLRDDLPDRPLRPERRRTGALFRRRQGRCDLVHEPLDGEQLPRDHGAGFPAPAQGPDRLHRPGDRRGGEEGGPFRGHPPGALHDPRPRRWACGLFQEREARLMQS